MPAHALHLLWEAATGPCSLTCIPSLPHRALQVSMGEYVETVSFLTQFMSDEEFDTYVDNVLAGRGDAILDDAATYIHPDGACARGGWHPGLFNGVSARPTHLRAGQRAGSVAAGAMQSLGTQPPQSTQAVHACTLGNGYGIGPVAGLAPLHAPALWSGSSSSNNLRPSTQHLSRFDAATCVMDAMAWPTASPAQCLGTITAAKWHTAVAVRSTRACPSPAGVRQHTCIQPGSART